MKVAFQEDYRKRIVQDILNAQGSDVDVDKVLEEISKDDLWKGIFPAVGLTCAFFMLGLVLGGDC